MSFRATNILPERALGEAKKTALQIKNFAAQASNVYGTVGADSFRIFNTLEGLIELRRRFNDFKTVSGLPQYAKDQENDQTYDVAVEFTTVIAAIDAVIAEVVATFPTDVNGYLLAAKLNPDGSLNHRTFSVAALVGIKNKLDDVVSSVA